MICPACKTNNIKNQNTEHCVQCGADIHMHRLLQKVQEKIQMNNDFIKAEPIVPQKTSSLFVLSQIIPSVLLLICALFGIFVGLRFLSFIDRSESQRSSISTKWSETGFEQLQQMNASIKQELDLILDQRRENLALQEKIQELTKSISVAQNTKETVLPSLVQGWK